MKFKLLCGLSAQVELSGDGSFRPRHADSSTLPLLADLRWRGFAAAISHGFVDRLVMLGGIEKLPIAEVPNDAEIMGGPFVEDGVKCIKISRGYATCHGLAKQYGIDWSHLSWQVTTGNTLGNVGGIMRALGELNVRPSDAAVSTNLYHVPRAYMDMIDAGLGSMMLVPAEAFWLASLPKGERVSIEAQLRNDFGNGPLTERIIGELNGAADKLQEEYAALSS